MRRCDTVLTMTEPSPPKAQQTTIRFDPEIRSELDRFAARTRRSLNGAVNYLIFRGLAAENAAEKPGK